MLGKNLRAMAQGLGFLWDANCKFLYGRIGPYPAWVREIPGSQLLLSAAAKPGENAVLPAAEDVRRILPEGPILSIKVTPFRWQVVVKRGKTPETILLLKRVFDTLVQYFAQNGYRPCCAKCGAEGVMPIYQCGQIMRALCDHCAGETAFLAEKDRKRPSKLGKGMLGALGGTALGTVVSLLLSFLFWTAFGLATNALEAGLTRLFGNTQDADTIIVLVALILLIPILSGMLMLAFVCGFLMMLPASKGYALLGGKFDVRGIAVSVLCVGAFLFAFYFWLFGGLSFAEPAYYTMGVIRIGGLYFDTSSLVASIIFCACYVPGIAIAGFGEMDRQKRREAFRRLL